MTNERASANNTAHRGPRVYLTGKTISAKWQRWRLDRAYRRPVTFLELRHIAYDLQRRGHPEAGAALLALVIGEAEKNVR